MAPVAIVPFASGALTNGISQLFNDEQTSDFSIKCKDTTFKVHKLILTAGSDFFKKACQEHFQEGEVGLIDLSDQNPEIIKAVLHHTYGMMYKVPALKCHVRFHVETYAAGEYFGLDSLKKEAAFNLAFLAKNSSLQNVDEQFRAPEVARRFFEVADVVYEHVPVGDRALKDIFVVCVLPFLKKVIAKLPNYEVKMRDVSGLASDLLCKLIDDPPGNPSSRVPDPEEASDTQLDQTKSETKDVHEIMGGKEKSMDYKGPQSKHCAYMIYHATSLCGTKRKRTE